jgi:hypothetical protein
MEVFFFFFNNKNTQYSEIRNGVSRGPLEWKYNTNTHTVLSTHRTHAAQNKQQNTKKFYFIKYIKY